MLFVLPNGEHICDRMHDGLMDSLYAYIKPLGLNFADFTFAIIQNLRIMFLLPEDKEVTESALKEI